MCGIIGYCSEQENAVEKLLAGLKKLEYRGYDSSGLSIFENNCIRTVKAQGRISQVEKKLAACPPLFSGCGVGHTRWATHGEPSDRNAHPHNAGSVSLVHNGIIENWEELKNQLEKAGEHFASDTDSEVAAVLLNRCYQQLHDPIAAIREAQKRWQGSFACAVLFRESPNRVYAFRRSSPLIAAETPDGMYIASDFAAVSDKTNQCYLLEESEIAVLQPHSIAFYTENGNLLSKKPVLMQEDRRDTGKGIFSHHMEKEIYDTPEGLIRTCKAYMRGNLPCFDNTSMLSILGQAERIHIVACGTAMHAGLLGKYYLQSIAGIQADCHIASEFRYYPPVFGVRDAVLLITQSGETADTLAALRLAKEKGLGTLAIVNTPNSSAAREADCVLFTRAGTEIAVASTKAYTAQAGLLYLIANAIALHTDKTDSTAVQKAADALLHRVPENIRTVLSQKEHIRELSRRYGNEENCFFIGRGLDYALAEESSLKLKEVSYIHSEAYPAGELKHGTIALIENGTAVIAIASGEHTHDKTLSNIREVQARGARVLLVTDRDIPPEKRTGELEVFTVPCPCYELFPLCAAPLFQLFAYYGAVLNGRDADKPRNLAKSVTVE